ncbi:MAG: cytochrome C oxidase subunit IV family protein [Anaerolineae bacterium]|nr:cytochrome C oxidase subunit IV family protein [Anaerolineae bacterium]
MEQTHAHPTPNYLSVFFILLIITLLEVGVTLQPVHDLLPFLVPIQIPVLLVLALAKAAYIVLYYMHLRYDSRVFAAVFLLGIFLGLLFTTAVLLR